MCQLDGVRAPFGAGLVNVRFPECTFVLDITLPTFGEYVSVGGCLCALWRSFGEYAFPKKPASEGNTETIQLTNIPNCLQNVSNTNLSIN